MDVCVGARGQFSKAHSLTPDRFSHVRVALDARGVEAAAVRMAHGRARRVSTLPLLDKASRHSPVHQPQLSATNTRGVKRQVLACSS